MSLGFTDMLTISGTHNGRQIFCNVVLMPVARLDGIGQDTVNATPKIVVLKALIDTGATATNITPSTAKKLDLSPIGFTEVTTGGGVISSPYYLFKIGFLNDANDSSEMLIPPNPIEGLELIDDNFSFDVLLGMDVLSKGNFRMSGHKFSFSL